MLDGARRTVLIPALVNCHPKSSSVRPQDRATHDVRSNYVFAVTSAAGAGMRNFRPLPNSSETAFTIARRIAPRLLGGCASISILARTVPHEKIFHKPSGSSISKKQSIVLEWIFVKPASERRASAKDGLAKR